MPFDELAIALRSALENTPAEKLEPSQLALTVGDLIGGDFREAPSITPLLSAIEKLAELRRLFGVYVQTVPAGT